MNPLLTDVAEKIHERFEPIVGQARAKERVTEILLGGALDGFIAPMLLVGPPGWGKSFFLKAMRDIIKGPLATKTLYAARGENLGTKAEFFEEIIIPKFHGQKSVVIGDEIHEAAKGVLSSIRSLLEPTADRCARTIQYNDSDVVFDPFLNSFVIATNRIDELDPALVSRFERIDLEAFSSDEMAEILFMGVKADGFTFHENSLAEIARCNRGSARDIIHWINAIRRRVAIQGKTTINKADCMAVIRSRNCFPEGVSALELATLLALERRGPLQLKELAALNQCSSAEQDDNERYLRGRGFIGVDTKRHITQDGRDYLVMLRREKFIEALPERACD